MEMPKYVLNDIISALATFHPQNIIDMTSNLKLAAVAMILRERSDVVEMLFIERAAYDRDPWSGHIAFPGGKMEIGENSRQTAERETYEEIGVILPETSYIGCLSDIVGTNLPVKVTCNLFVLELDIQPSINEEVHDLFWIPLHEIYNSQHHASTTVYFANKTFEVPSIKLLQAGKPVLWGITYKLVMQLYEILKSKFNASCNLTNKRYTHKIEHL